jgi:Uma2 family endonuclease
MTTSNTPKKRNPTIEDFNFPEGLPTAADLPCSDDKPVDGVIQEIIPSLLRDILTMSWSRKTGWLFAIDLGFYYNPKLPAIAPNGMLCLGIREDPYENYRPSYVLWEEKVIPLFTVEIVCHTTSGEWQEKMGIYQYAGILYCLIYVPSWEREVRFQLYKLIEGEYILQSNGKSPYWMPEVGLGIGTEVIKHGNLKREWLVWYDEAGVRYPTPAERYEAEQSLRQAAERQAEIERSLREAAVEIERSSREAVERDNALLRQRRRDLGIDE